MAYDVEGLDLVTPIYKLLEYSLNYSDTTGSLWFHSKDKPTNFNDAIADNNNFKSLKYKTKLIGSTAAANGILEDTTIVVSLKYVTNFKRSLEMQLINCKVELKLKWTRNCVLATVSVDNINANDSVENTNANDKNNIFTIKDTKLYVPVVTLSAKGNQKLSKLPSKGSERSVYWNDYTTKSKNKNTTKEYI